MDEKGQLLVSCKEALLFPRNLVCHNDYEHTLNSYYNRLNEFQTKLFQDESKSALDFSELDYDSNGRSTTIRLGMFNYSIRMDRAYLLYHSFLAHLRAKHGRAQASIAY